MAGLVSLENALELVLARSRRLPEEEVTLDDAVGRYLARAAVALIDVPPFPSSAMDGYAIRAEDAPGTFVITAAVAAGHPSSALLPPAGAAEISTGGVVPDGADSVVPIERVTAVREGRIRVEEPVGRGDHVRPRGGDVLAGETVADVGARLGVTQIAALATAGVSRMTCFRRARVCVLTTGSELREPGDRLEPGEIYESNGRMLAALFAELGADVCRLASVADDEEAHRRSFEAALAADVVVTSGGVSVGRHDLVRATAARCGVDEVFWGVAVRPGKPVSFGVRDTTLVFGLPGNPVSSLVGALLLVCPAIRAMNGVDEPAARSLPGVLGRPLARNDRRDDLVRAAALTTGRHVVLEPIEGQDSHMIIRASRADSLVLVPRGEGLIAAGDPVRYYPLRAGA